MVGVAAFSFPKWLFDLFLTQQLILPIPKLISWTICQPLFSPKLKLIRPAKLPGLHKSELSLTRVSAPIMHKLWTNHPRPPPAEKAECWGYQGPARKAISGTRVQEQPNNLLLAKWWRAGLCFCQLRVPLSFSISLSKWACDFQHGT